MTEIGEKTIRSDILFKSNSNIFKFLNHFSFSVRKSSNKNMTEIGEETPMRKLYEDKLCN